MSEYRECRSLALKGVRLALAAALSLSVLTATAGDRERAKRIHDRLAGVPPTESVLADMAADINAGNVEDAAYTAMQNRHFYDVTIKNMVMPWTNEARTVFAPLNDYVATVIGLIRDDKDFRQVLYGDVVYTADGFIPAYSPNDNAHYQALDDQDANLKDVLVEHRQSALNSELPAAATAGVLTTRQAAKAFFIDGTNRAMFRFTMINYFCRDMEQLKDTRRPPDRIRQDVSRSPGGDSRIFLNNCVGCHSGMDPMAQAYAYYDYTYDEETDPEGQNGHLIFNAAGETDPVTESRVVEKYRINADNFPYGYITADDHWDNYWREGRNAVLDWGYAPVDPSIDGSGTGMKSLGKEMASSYAFAECQAKKVFRTVCLRQPTDSADRSEVSAMADSLKSNGFKLKKSFAEAAVYCSTDVQ